MGNESGKSVKECTDKDHSGKESGLCKGSSCKKSVCVNCAIKYNNKQLCMECKLFEQN